MESSPSAGRLHLRGRCADRIRHPGAHHFRIAGIVVGIRRSLYRLTVNSLSQAGAKVTLVALQVGIG
jgi:hypothetical protein